MSENNDSKTFREKHPGINLLLGIIILIIILIIGALGLYIAISLIGKSIQWLVTIVSKLDAVIIVALITGAVSIIGVLISSGLSKYLDYRRCRQEYLAQKREEPYGEFVDMVYKILDNTKNRNNYTQQEMLKDISKFSKQITLWGSSNVVNKWVKFRENSQNPENTQKNVLVMEDIMNEMRKDLGLKKVKRGNLLAFFINDIKEAMKTLR